MGKKLTTEEFIRRAKEVHGDKYNYSKVEYVNNRTKVCIICPIHGEFLQTPNDHLSGHGCKKCRENNLRKCYSLTLEDFINKAHEVHGDKYDYSKVEYINSKTKVRIVCPKHGEFLQTPNMHLRGSGCPNCGIESRTSSRKNSLEDFINKAREVHGDKYDYSKVEYVDSHTKVCIICPKHGEFWQSPNTHLSGHGCIKCCKYRIGPKSKLTTEEFIRRAKEIHGDKYDYSKVEYVDFRTKVCIICPEHGEFWQAPKGHLNGQGCSKCAGMNKTTEEWIEEARKIHGDKYDYSKVNYVNSYTKVCIICPEHGEFWQIPKGHLDGCGCSKCSKRLTTEEFIRRAREVHGDKYDYSKAEYVDSKTKVCIICPEHGEFWQTPSNHLNGRGCPYCNVGYTKQYKFNLLQEFKDEYEFRAFLENNDENILYAILSAIEPKYDPLKRDIERVLNNGAEIDPIKMLEDKYTNLSDDDEDIDDEKLEEELSAAIDLDNDDAVPTMLPVSDSTKPDLTIDDMVKNTEKEIKVINKIEHFLTPDVRKYIMEKFLNDKRRAWMLKREESVK